MSSGTVIDTIGGSALGDADGDSANATFTAPFGVAASADGTVIYVTDASSNKLRVYNMTSGTCCGNHADAVVCWPSVMLALRLFAQGLCPQPLALQLCRQA
jgi:DNA-binding beta-propeller fold protein YncE